MLIANTKHVQIDKRSHNGNIFYVVFWTETKNSKFYTLEDAFRFARQEVRRNAGRRIKHAKN